MLVGYYVTNLILTFKFEDAQKALTHYKKQEDKLVTANLIRLQGVIDSHYLKDYPQANQCFVKARQLFKDVYLVRGQALCNFALGFLYFTKTEFFTLDITEDQCFKRAKKYMTDASNAFESVVHPFGVSRSNTILCHIMSKLQKQST